MQAIINKYTTDIMPTPHSVKEIIIKHIIKQAFGYDSTTELKKTQEIDKVIDMVNMLNAKMGIEYVPFPSEEHEQDELKDLINENNK